MKQREITGRTVLVLLIAFFAVVAGANAVLIRAATSTLGGVEVDSSYKAGLAFMREVTAAREQDARHWSVTAHFDKIGENANALTISVRDRAGAPVSGIAVDAKLGHPADARRDHAVALRSAELGLFKGTTDAEPAQWDLLIEIKRGDERLFRSKSRVVLK